MGASADEIDRQVKRTRKHIDDELGVLEQRVPPDAVRRYASIVAVVLGVAAVAGVGVFIYRRGRARTRRERLQGAVIEGLKQFPDSVRRGAPLRWAMRRVG